MLDDQPLAFLDTTAREISACPECASAMIRPLRSSGATVELALARAIEWLLRYPSTRPATSAQALPAWLAELDRSVIFGAARRKEGPGAMLTSYLVEIELPGGHVGTMQARLDRAADGRLINAFVSDESLRFMQSSLDWIARTEPPPDQRPGPYRAIEPETAIRALRAAVAAADADPVPIEPYNPWPANRPLVTFVLDVLGSGPGGAG